MTREMGAALRRIQLGSALSAFGLGFTVPYLYVYVAQVRDLGAGTAGVVLAAFAMAALAVLPFTGRAIDRRGPLPVLVVASVLASVGAAALGFASSVPAAVLSAAVLGAGTAVMQLLPPRCSSGVPAPRPVRGPSPPSSSCRTWASASAGSSAGSWWT